MPNTFDKEKCRDTFHPWRIYEPSEIKNINIEEYDGKDPSGYIDMFNYIKDRGWYRKDKQWVSPDGKWKFYKIYEAYRCQRYLEVLDE